MATKNIAIVSTTLTCDTAATPNTAVYRDSNGGIAGAAITGTTLQTTGTFQGAPVAQASSFTAGAATDYLCDTTAGTITVTLPLASANVGVVYYFLKVASANSLTISGASGTATATSQWSLIRVFTDGTTWYAKAF